MPARFARLALLAGIATLGASCPPDSAAQSGAGACSNGAMVDPAYCKFFVQYEHGPVHALDSRIAESLGLPGDRSDATRSIALIIAIDKYPLLPKPEDDLSAAGVDRQNLVDYLKGPQKFDEVIVLANEDATVDNINYFLDYYLKNRGDSFVAEDGQSRARLLIAFSGHGRPDSEPRSKDAAYILAGAKDIGATSSVYRMSDLAGRVQQLSRHYFHILTLINACFGGNTFTAVSGGNANDETAPGSYVITAGTDKETVPAPDPSRGSLFFDIALTGLKSGKIDPDYLPLSVSDGAGSVSSRSQSLTRTGALFDHIDRTIVRRNYDARTSPKYAKISRPWWGPDQWDGPAMGGFFFLTDRPVQTARADGAGAGSMPGRPRTLSDVGQSAPDAPTLADRLLVPLGPLSSIRGRPDLKIFKSPNIYPIHGYDLSSEEGAIDWKTVRLRKPTFIYARALGWKGRDRTFTDRWSNALAIGTDRGAYLKFNFCQDADAQRKAFGNVIGIAEDALPPAIQVVEPQPSDDASQAKCYRMAGKAVEQQRMLDLAGGLQRDFGKVPVFFGNVYNINLFTDQRFEPFMIWLARYNQSGTTGLMLKGENPWTLWQFTSAKTVAGIGDDVAETVFFGTREQYAGFKSGRSNAGRSAAVR
jgi:lysozyme